MRSSRDGTITQPLPDIFDRRFERTPAMATPAEILKELHRLRRYGTDLQKRLDQLPKRRDALQEVVAHQEKKLADTQAHLRPGDLRVQYERLVRQRGDDAFAPMRGKSCQACFMEVTPQMYNELQQGRFVLCRNCGRILYPAE